MFQGYSPLCGLPPPPTHFVKISLQCSRLIFGLWLGLGLGLGLGSVSGLGSHLGWLIYKIFDLFSWKVFYRNLAMVRITLKVVFNNDAGA